MEIMVISNPLAVPDEHHIINALFSAGLKYFHLRKPESSIKSISEILSEIKPEFYARISIHQFHEMAANFGLKRLHYTEAARTHSSAEQRRRQIEAGFQLSTSIHDLQSVTELHDFKYAFLGPVFDSISKPGYLGTINGKIYRDSQHTATRLIALGGISLSTLHTVKAMGFDGAAVLGCIWQEPAKALECYTQLIKIKHQ